MLAVHNVEVIYPNGFTGLQQTSVRFDRGQFIVLLGTSGAGKSTLLRTLNGLVKPTRGDIVIDG